MAITVTSSVMFFMFPSSGQQFRERWMQGRWNWRSLCWWMLRGSLSAEYGSYLTPGGDRVVSNTLWTAKGLKRGDGFWSCPARSVNYPSFGRPPSQQSRHLGQPCMRVVVVPSPSPLEAGSGGGYYHHISATYAPSGQVHWTSELGFPCHTPLSTCWYILVWGIAWQYTFVVSALVFSQRLPALVSPCVSRCLISCVYSIIIDWSFLIGLCVCVVSLKGSRSRVPVCDHLHDWSARRMKLPLVGSAGGRDSAPRSPCGSWLLERTKYFQVSGLSQWDKGPSLNWTGPSLMT